MPYRNGKQGMDPGLQPINVKLYISLHPDTKPRDPPQSGPVTHSCQLVNQQNSLGWGGFDNLTTNWPYQGHKIPYLVPRTINCLPALWPDSDNWAHTPGMYSVATKSWWVLYSWLIEDPLWDDPGGIHNRISERSWILLSDMNGQISNTTLYQISHQLTTFSIWINPHYWTPPLEFVYSAWVAMGEPYLWRTANMSWRTCVVVKQMQSNPNPGMLATWCIFLATVVRSSGTLGTWHWST